MAVIQYNRVEEATNFTAEELVGRQIRIETPAKKPTGNFVRIIADDALVGNAYKVEITMEAGNITEAKIWLYRLDLPDVPTEIAVLRDTPELSFSAIVSEVQ